MKNDATPLLKAVNIEMYFGGLRALSGLDIEVYNNEILGLIGPNGSGKTTFFNVVTGIYIPTKGEIFYNNKNIAGKKPREIAKAGISRTFQNSRLWMELSVVENVLLGMFIQKKSKFVQILFNYQKIQREFAEKIDAAKEILSVFNPELATNCHKKASDLSLVDRRRVEICRAIAAKPKLLLLDEPSSGMDSAETRDLMYDIEKLKRERGNIGIIIIEHDMHVISTIAERVIVLNFGNKIVEGTFEVIKSNSEVREAYLGK